MSYRIVTLDKVSYRIVVLDQAGPMGQVIGIGRASDARFWKEWRDEGTGEDVLVLALQGDPAWGDETRDGWYAIRRGDPEMRELLYAIRKAEGGTP